ncbi:hypothetical protein [Aliarcobacter cibarius]|uniref:Uncharacterized protein n=1 Tax=Aliarcobacter cibarius TaxID=255507 RepID=A0A7L5JPL3_9BACT|nr:hypothetical protein [Aliarcobacter cibarius]QKJ27147.1 hypothetical protein ACBT_1238 [Aliarcobacter cibarius]
MKYFLKYFFVYLLLIIGFAFILIEKNISDLNGKDTDSEVEFVYEEF